jgi:hypothetical protein
VTYSQRKKGRVVEALTFRFGPKAMPVAAKPAAETATKPKLTRAYVERHARPGETWDQALARLRQGSSSQQH